MRRTLIANMVKTPDGTILHSKHQHDFVCHTDKVTGKRYCNDGGISYGRFVGDYDDCEDVSVYLDDTFEKIRDSFVWGTRGPKGDQPLTYKKLRELDEDHIYAIIETQSHLPSWMVDDIFMQEIRYREQQAVVCGQEKMHEVDSLTEAIFWHVGQSDDWEPYEKELVDGDMVGIVKFRNRVTGYHSQIRVTCGVDEEMVKLKAKIKELEEYKYMYEDLTR